MGSFKRPRVFDPLDLEIIERAYEAAWAEIVAREPNRDASKDDERKMFLRKRMFVTVCKGMTDTHSLRDKVLASMQPTPKPQARPQRRSFPKAAS